MRKCNVHIFFFAVTANEILYSQVRHWKRGIDSCQPIMASGGSRGDPGVRANPPLDPCELLFINYLYYYSRY